MHDSSFSVVLSFFISFMCLPVCQCFTVTLITPHEAQKNVIMFVILGQTGTPKFVSQRSVFF